MKKIERNIRVVVISVCLSLGVSWGLWRVGIADSFTVDPLVQSCAIILNKGEQFGMGFFVECTYGGAAEIWFVTAAHNLYNLTKQEGREVSRITLAVKSSQSAGAVKLTVPCNSQTVKVSSAQDVALIRVDKAVLAAARAEISPVKYGLSPKRHGGKRCAARAELLLKSDRERLGIRVGNDVLAVSSLKCDENALLNDFFPLLVRKGVLSLIHEASGSNAAEGNRMVIDVLSFPGNSGAPVFIYAQKKKWRTLFCNKKPHVLGLISTTISAEGRPQALDLPVYDEARQKGRAKGLQVLKENTGLSLIVPADQIAWLFAKHYGGHEHAK